MRGGKTSAAAARRPCTPPWRPRLHQAKPTGEAATSCLLLAPLPCSTCRGMKREGRERPSTAERRTFLSPPLHQSCHPPRRHRRSPSRCMAATRRSGHGGTRSAHLGGGSSAPRPHRRRGPTAAPAVAAVPGTSSSEQREAHHRSPSSSTFPAPRPLRCRVPRPPHRLQSWR
jgi:hypothetical protein